MKYCPECGQANDDIARFCENCGKELPQINEIHSAQTPQAPADHQKFESKPERSTPIGKRIKRYFVGLLVFVILLGGGYCLFKYLNKVPTPIEISEQYMGYLKAQDYENAYKLINPELKLDKDTYIYSMKEQDNQYGKIKEFRIETEQSNLYWLKTDLDEQSALLYENIQVTIGRNERETKYLVITNISAGEKPDLRIDLSDQVRQTNIQLPVIPKLEVKLAKKPLNLDQSGSATIMYLDGVPVNLEISSPDIVSQSFDIPREDGSTSITLQVSDKLQKQLQGIIEGFNKADVQAKIDGKMEHYAPYLSRDSKKWLELQEYCNYFIQSLSSSSSSSSSSSNYSVKKTLKNAQYVRGFFIVDNIGKVCVQIDDTESWTTETTYSSGSPSISENTIEWTYEFELQQDGSWKIRNYWTR